MTTVQKIAEIEAEMARTQKNKATNGHLGMLKAKLAKFKRELLEPSSGGGGGGGSGFDVSKTGDTRVGLVGFPSVGKSTLLTKLTGTFSEAASYEFTTLTCVPGSMTYKGAKIQVLDLPGIIEGAKDGKGRGRQVISTARTCNVILIVLDAAKPVTMKGLLEHELEGFGIRLNKTPPRIRFRKKDKGGISCVFGVPQTNGMDLQTLAGVLKEYRIPCADVAFRCDATVDDLIDVIEPAMSRRGQRVYMPCIYVMNKIDQITIEELDLIDQLPHYIPISAAHEWNFDALLEMVWQYAKMLRIYTKPKGQVPDYTAPVILYDAAPSLELFCNRIHKGILSQFKYAWVWGKSVKHQPMKVGIKHSLCDEDVVQIVKKT